MEPFYLSIPDSKIIQFYPPYFPSPSALDPLSNMIPLRDLFNEELPEATAKTIVSKTPSSRSSFNVIPIHGLAPINENEFYGRLGSPEATARLSRTAHPVNSESNRVLKNEADVVRLAYEHLTHPVSLAFLELSQVSEQIEGITRIDTLCGSLVMK